MRRSDSTAPSASFSASSYAPERAVHEAEGAQREGFAAAAAEAAVGPQGFVEEAERRLVLAEFEVDGAREAAGEPEPRIVLEAAEAFDRPGEDVQRGAQPARLAQGAAESGEGSGRPRASPSSAQIPAAWRKYACDSSNRSCS